MEQVIGIDVGEAESCAVIGHFDGPVIYIDDIIRGDCIETEKHVIIDGTVIDLK